MRSLEPHDLSPREVQTLVNACQGRTDKEIAVRLGVSLTTVRTYWERVFVKLEAVNRAQAVAIFIKGRAAEIPSVQDEPVEPNTLLQAAIDVALGGILVLGEARTILASNEKAHALMNCVPGMIDGQKIEKFIPPTYKPFYRVLDGAMAEDVENTYVASAFVKVFGDHDLLASITIRTLDGPEGRYTVLFMQDSMADLDARRRGHHWKY